MTKSSNSKIDGHVPVLDDTCKVYPKEQFQKDKHLKKLLAMPTSQSSPKAARDVEQDSDQLDELVADDDQQEYIRSRKAEDLRAQHQYTHTSRRTHFAEPAKEQE